MRRMIACVLMVLCVLMALPASADSGYGFLTTRTYDGRTYTARPAGELTTILLIGYDHDEEGAATELHGFSNGGQADFLLLVVLDHRYDRIHLLQIDRDTMTAVRVMDSTGRTHDRSSLQICLAHAYGDTREKNNANTVLAVENLLDIGAGDDGIAIDWYVAMDISGISRLNDLLGGVTVTITEDLTQIDPAMTEGATVTLTGEQAERFCRGRLGVGDQTNVSRMRRQRAYISAAGAQLIARMKENSSFGTKLLDGMGVIYDMSARSSSKYNFAASYEGTPIDDDSGRWLMSNAQRRTLVAEVTRAADYTLMETETLPGVHSVGSDGFIRFDLEEEAAVRWALDMFYRTDE